MISSAPDGPTRRVLCPRCRLPSTSCLCGLATCIENRVDVLILQHPAEAREAKGTVRLLGLCLQRCQVVVGEEVEAGQLQAWLHGGPGRRSVLLYPDEGHGMASPGASADTPRVVPAPVAPATQLVVLDGTWRQSAKMLRAHPVLQGLPRIALQPLAAGRYAALRKARRPNQMSTLEATCAALALLEDAPARYAPLLAAFEAFVAARLAWAGSGRRQDVCAAA